MRKFGLLALSAALLMSCGVAKPSTSSASSKAEESSLSSESVASSSESSESIESSESSEPVESSESSESVESSESSAIISSEDSSNVLPNDGSAEYPFTVSEAYAIAVELAEGENNGQQYCIKGVITEDPKYPDNPVYVKSGRASFYITDDESVLYVYNMNDEDNKASYTNDNKPQLGDEIVVAGALSNFGGKLEICYVKNVANCYRVA